MANTCFHYCDCWISDLFRSRRDLFRLLPGTQGCCVRSDRGVTVRVTLWSAATCHGCSSAAVDAVNPHVTRLKTVACLPWSGLRVYGSRFRTAGSAKSGDKSPHSKEKLLFANPLTPVV